MWLFAHETEPSCLVDAASGVKDAVRPERDLPVLRLTGKADALVHEPVTNPEPARFRFHEQEPELRDGVGFPHEEHRTDALTVLFRDPARPETRIEVLNELGNDLGDECLEALIPAVLARVQHTVAKDDPADVTRLMRAQQIRTLRLGRRREDALDRSHRVGQTPPIVLCDLADQRGDLIVGSGVQASERGGTGLGEPQRRLPRVAFGARFFDQLSVLEAAKYPPEVA